MSKSIEEAFTETKSKEFSSQDVEGHCYNVLEPGNLLVHLGRSY